MKYFIRILLFSSLFFASCSKQENEVLLKQLDDIKAMGELAFDSRLLHQAEFFRI